MRPMLTVLLACQLVGTARGETANQPVELERLAALPIEGPPRLQPSGLVVRDGTLYAVSDKHPDTVFEVVRESGRAVFREAVVFSPPAGTAAGVNLDLEGITIDADGRFHLVSEAACRVLTLDETGLASWTTPSLKPAGRAVGFFSQRGGGLEGIHWLEDGTYLLAAERQLRGFLRVSATGGSPAPDAWPMEERVRTPPKGRSLDFAGLAGWRGRLFVLERNLHLVSELIADENRFVLGDSWSYAATENDPALLYTNSTYGLAEGLALTDEEVLVLVDNNGLGRAIDTEDRRPLMLVFRNPFG